MKQTILFILVILIMQILGCKKYELRDKSFSLSPWDIDSSELPITIDSAKIINTGLGLYEIHLFYSINQTELISKYSETKLYATIEFDGGIYYNRKLDINSRKYIDIFVDYGKTYTYSLNIRGDKKDSKYSNRFSIKVQ